MVEAGCDGTVKQVPKCARRQPGGWAVSRHCKRPAISASCPCATGEHKVRRMHSFLRDLKTQRWDDHRYYHHSRINQSLHLLSALCFLTTYVTIFRSPTAAAMIGWLGAMVSRQLGHFFFEPKGYDQVNRASHEHKEAIKVGYNLRRKVVLLSLWGISPLALWADPTLFGLFPNAAGRADLFRH